MNKEPRSLGNLGGGESSWPSKKSLRGQSKYGCNGFSKKRGTKRSEAKSVLGRLKAERFFGQRTDNAKEKTLSKKKSMSGSCKNSPRLSQRGEQNGWNKGKFKGAILRVTFHKGVDGAILQQGGRRVGLSLWVPHGKI